MSKPTSTVNQQVFECPACGQDVYASVVVEFTLDQAVVNGGKQDVTATGRVTGLRVSHDCTPKAIRGRGDEYRATWNGDA